MDDNISCQIWASQAKYGSWGDRCHDHMTYNTVHIYILKILLNQLGLSSTQILVQGGWNSTFKFGNTPEMWLLTAYVLQYNLKTNSRVQPGVQGCTPTDKNEIILRIWFKQVFFFTCSSKIIHAYACIMKIYRKLKFRQTCPTLLFLCIPHNTLLLNFLSRSLESWHQQFSISW